MNSRTAAVRCAPGIVTRRRFLQFGPAGAAAAWYGAHASAGSSPDDAVIPDASRVADAAASVILLHLPGQTSDRGPALGDVSGVDVIAAPPNDSHNGMAPAWVPQITNAAVGTPSLGAWITHALTTIDDQRTLPLHVVLARRGGRASMAALAMGRPGGLPSHCQGILCSGRGDPVLFLSDPDSDKVPVATCGAMVAAINQIKYRDYQRIRGFAAAPVARGEYAFRMQKAANEAVDLGREAAWVRRMYGARLGRETFANQCLMARRLIERGARCVQLLGCGFDAPVAALLSDLRRTGLLKRTLVIGSGAYPATTSRASRESDPTPSARRRHQAHAVTTWIAGGGMPEGISASHATILHRLGIDAPWS